MATSEPLECFLQTTIDQVRWGEAYLKNRDGSPREYWPHQREDLRCEHRNIVHLDGRAVGKSLSLTTLILHYAFTTHGGRRRVKKRE